MFLISWDKQNKKKISALQWCYKEIWPGNMWSEFILYLLVWFWALWVVVLCSLIVSMLLPPVSASFLILLCGAKLLNHFSESGYSLKLQWSLHHVSPHIPLKFHLIYHIFFIMGWAALVNWELIERCHELGYKPFFFKVWLYMYATHGQNHKQK